MKYKDGDILEIVDNPQVYGDWYFLIRSVLPDNTYLTHLVYTFDVRCLKYLNYTCGPSHSCQHFWTPSKLTHPKFQLLLSIAKEPY